MAMADSQLESAEEMMDRIFAEKGPRPYKDGFSEDTWEEEIEHIPLFMSKPPDVIDPVKDSALLALQSMKYEDDTPLGQAKACKEDGNHYFKEKQYKKAISSYSAGVKVEFDDDELKAVMYTNRATCHYNMGNYRSAILDCTHASKHNPSYVKCYYRAASACMELKKYTEVLQWSDRGLGHDPDNKQLLNLRTRAVKEQKAFERDKRKESKIVKKKLAEQEELLSIIRSKGIKLDGFHDGTDVASFMEELNLSNPHPSAGAVKLNKKEGTLSWPVVFLYPEFGQSDYVESFHERDCFSDHLAVILSTPPPWDTEHLYKPDTVNIYFEDTRTQEMIQVTPTQTLNSIISSNRYTVVSGTPSFILLSKNSRFMQSFLSRLT